jgi:hypothetical protein
MKTPTCTIPSTAISSRRWSGHIRRRLAVLRPRYTPGQLAGFLCNGLWGFISESHAEKRDRETVRREARGLLEDLLRAQILAVQP